MMWKIIITIILAAVDIVSLNMRKRKDKMTMTIEQIAKRADKSQTLKCYKLKDGTFLVESTDGKILYPVSVNGTVSCTCADFQRNIKTDATFRCKHIWLLWTARTALIP